MLGWTVGLQFNKAIFLLALKTLPQIIASILGLILMCALMALALTHILQMDFMTAYLATSPAGWTRWRLRRRHPGGHVVYYGATDAAAVYHFADRLGDGAGYSRHAPR